MKEYYISRMTKTICGDCESKNVWWLKPRDMELTDNDPTFFVCKKCSWIGQVGVGEVKKEL